MRRQLGVVFTIVFIDLVGFGIVLPLMPAFAASYGISPAAIGVLVTSYSLLQLLVSPLWGAFSDRIGRRPVLLIGLLGSTASYVLFALSGGFWLLLVSRVIAGSMGATVGVAQAYVADITEPERRAQSLGILGAGFALGFILGPAIGGVLYQHGHAMAGFVAAALCGANTLAALAWLPETPQHKSRRRSGRVPVRPLAAPLAASFLLVTAFAVIHVSLPLLAQEELRLNTRRIGILFAFSGVISAIVQGGLVGRIAPRVGEARLALVGGLLMATGLALMPGSAHVGHLYLALGFLSMGSAASNPAILAAVSRMTASHLQGSALGFMQTAQNLGRIVGPLLAGALYGALGHAAPFLAGAGIALMGALATLFFPVRPRGTPETSAAPA
jgi:DHA1 family tetracycline resistance protein-like MFS transporter